MDDRAWNLFDELLELSTSWGRIEQAYREHAVLCVDRLRPSLCGGPGIDLGIAADLTKHLYAIAQMRACQLQLDSILNEHEERRFQDR